MADSPINLKNIQNHPIKTSVGTLLTIGAFLWVLYRPVLIEDLSADFVTKAELVKNTNDMTTQLREMKDGMDNTRAAVDGLVTQVNVAAAFQMERGFQDDLDKHDADKPSPPTRRWLEIERDLTAKRDLATKYKDCVLTESKNCELLQKQLWQ